MILKLIGIITILIVAFFGLKYLALFLMDRNSPLQFIFIVPALLVGNIYYSIKEGINKIFKR